MFFRQEVERVARIVTEDQPYSWKVPAAIAILESGWGKTLRAPFNVTNMKYYPTMWQQGGKVLTVSEEDGPEQSAFVVYRNLEHCLQHLVDTFQYSRYYREHTATAKRRITGATIEFVDLNLIRAVKSYCTKPEWADRVISVYEEL